VRPFTPRGSFTSYSVSTRNGPRNVLPPSTDVTTRYWSSSVVSPLMKPTHSCPVVGLIVGCEPWLSSQPLLSRLPGAQNSAEPLIRCGADHERAWSSE
jgi:hypothetical protein